jgi:long-chain fatty acid transport protein
MPVHFFILIFSFFFFKISSAFTILSSLIHLKNIKSGGIMSKLFITIFILFLSVGVAFSSGWQIGEHGARAEGMASAFVAQASDASAIYFNPAGLTNLKGLNVMAGATMIAFNTTFTGPTPSTTETDLEKQTFFPPHAYVTYSMENNLSFGIGFFVPYGLGTKWPADWPGRYLAVDSKLMAYYINPSIAYKFSDKFSAGIGVSYVMGNVTLKRKAPTYSTLLPPTPSPTDGQVELKGDGSNVNFNAGILYKATDMLSIGVSYRSLTKIKFKGDATFSQMQALSSFFPGGDGETELPMPADLKAGVAYRFNENFLAEVDFEYVFWDAYKNLALDIPDGPAFPLTGEPLQTSSTQVQDYKNAYMIRLGGQYSMDKLSLRAGFVYDMTPVPDKSLEPLLPDADRMEGLIGLGYQISEQVRVDAAYQFIKPKDRTVSSDVNEFPGTYKSSANIVGLTVGLAL